MSNLYLCLIYSLFVNRDCIYKILLYMHYQDGSLHYRCKNSFINVKWLTQSHTANKLAARIEIRNFLPTSPVLSSIPVALWTLGLKRIKISPNPKGCGFDSGEGHAPGLQVDPGPEGVCGRQPMFLSQLISLSSPPNALSFTLSEKRKKRKINGKIYS